MKTARLTSLLFAHSSRCQRRLRSATLTKERRTNHVHRRRNDCLDSRHCSHRRVREEIEIAPIAELRCLAKASREAVERPFPTLESAPWTSERTQRVHTKRKRSTALLTREKKARNDVNTR